MHLTTIKLTALHCFTFAITFLPSSHVLAFGFDDVAEKARQLAAASYNKPAKNLSKPLEALT